MLDFIRQKKQSMVIKVVFVVIVLSFVGTMFLVWGKGEDGRGGSSGYAAKVNGTTISMEDYQRSYQRIRNIYLQIYGQSIPPELEQALKLKKVALETLVDNLLISKEAKKMGIKVTKEDVSNSIAAIPAFQKNGAFNFDVYQQVLRSSRITAEDFENSQREELTIKKAKQSIIDKVKVSDEDALAQYRKEKDKIELEFVSFSPADVIGEVKVTEAELNDFLQKNQNEFKTAEKAAISYILLDPASLAAGMTVSDEEIQTFYQKNMDRWQSKDGILPLNEVKEKVKAEALKQKAAKKTYEMAADTLYKNISSGDLNLVAGQLKAKVHDLPLFAAAAPPQQLAGEEPVIKKAFELKQGEMGGPVETSRGIYIVKKREHKPAVVPPLAEIKSAVEQKAKVAKSVELAQKKAQEAVGQLAGKSQLKTTSTGIFSFNEKGEIPVIGVAPELMEAAFKLTPAAPAATSPFKVGNRWYAVRLKQRIEAPKAEFDSTKEQIKQKLLPKKQDEAQEKWIKELREKAKVEINPAIIEK